MYTVTLSNIKDGTKVIGWKFKSLKILANYIPLQLTKMATMVDCASFMFFKITSLTFPISILTTNVLIWNNI